MSTPKSAEICSADKELSKEPWYHGLLPREDIKMMLRKNGDFLVRSTEPRKGEPRCFVLSVMYKEEKEDDGIKHYIILRTESNKFIIEKMAFTSISAMVEHHLKSQESIVKNMEVPLLTPVVRQDWELGHECVKLTKKLGEGAFGEVYMGKLAITKGPEKGKFVDVAVKLAKLENLTKEQIKEIMSEARLMRRFDHPHVVKFYGVAAGQEPLMVLMELANNGALDSYLQKHPNIPMHKLNEMVVQGGQGIEYLHSQNVLHRDIAARNCLYGGGKVKIADFGLSVEGTVYQLDPRKKVPIRWLAPETLRTGAYSQKTDVWAFGIMAWEIYNGGREPYPGMMVAEVLEKVKDGFRMSFPHSVHREIAKFFVEVIWIDDQSARPLMPEAMKQLMKLTAACPTMAPATLNKSMMGPSVMSTSRTLTASRSAEAISGRKSMEKSRADRGQKSIMKSIASVFRRNNSKREKKKH